MGVCMQPMSHDAYKRDMASKQWVDPARSRAGLGEEQGDQWALLRHEVVGEERQSQDEVARSMARSNLDQRDTDANLVSSPSPFDLLTPAQQQVDIVVVGVGGGGMNAINRMISTNVRGVRFVALNTDAQVLALSQAPHRICLGQRYTKGLGAGGNAATGMRAATESAPEIRAALGSADLVFIAAGMGGGTGTGAAPVVASIARKLGALTVGIVTFPFTFEGSRRRRLAEQGIAELSAEIDALITVPNDRLLTTVTRERNLSDAFKVADDVLRQGVQGIAEVINVPGMINVDFADVRSVLHSAGTALMSIGQGAGRNRAREAAEEAIAGGFLNVTIRGAQRVLFNISGGEDLTLFEVTEVAERIRAAIDDAADITFGAVIDPALQDTLRVTLIAAGMEETPTMPLEAVRLDHLTHAPRAAFPARPPSSTVPPGRVSANGQSASSLPPAQPAPSRQPDIQATRLPPAIRPTGATPAGSGPGNAPGAGPGTTPGTGRQQRSLNDLRGIRSMGQRHEALRKQRLTSADDEPIDVPPFLKRHE